jgi:hypothetical protein
MSFWWSIDLFVMGDFDRLEEFDDALPSLFHEVGEVERLACGGRFGPCRPELWW